MLVTGVAFAARPSGTAGWSYRRGLLALVMASSIPKRLQVVRRGLASQFAQILAERGVSAMSSADYMRTVMRLRLMVGRVVVMVLGMRCVLHGVGPAGWRGASGIHSL